MFKQADSLLNSNNIIQIISKIRPFQAAKSYKTDSERMVYSSLLEYSVSYLQSLEATVSKAQQKNQTKLSDLQYRFFSPLFEEIINLASRQCSQKAAILKMLFDFYQQGVSHLQKNCEQRLRSMNAEYFSNCQKKEEQYTTELTLLKNRLKALQEESDKKWKTFYMIVRDNRVLRRQKGKLMRVVQEQKFKIANYHEEMIKISRQNEKNKLLACYQEEKESLHQFLKNSLSINRLEKFMKDYPKASKRLLKLDLHRLQVAEQNALNEKVDYILKTASEFQEIYDEYEDLIDIAKPNRILFNVSTQTQPQDIPNQHHQVNVKPFRMNKLVQTYPQPMKMSFQEVDVIIGKKQPQKYRRRQAAQISVSEMKKATSGINLNHKKAVKKELMLAKRQVCLKIPSKVERKQFEIISQVFNFILKFSRKVEGYPYLPTSYQLDKDMSRSKQYVYKKQSQRSMRLSGLSDNSKSKQRHSQAMAKGADFEDTAKFEQKRYSRKGAQNHTEKLSSSSRFSINGRSTKDRFKTSKSKLSRINTEIYDVNTMLTNFCDQKVLTQEQQVKQLKVQEKVEENVKMQMEQEWSNEENKQIATSNFYIVQKSRNSLLPPKGNSKLRKSGFMMNKPSIKNFASNGGKNWSAARISTVRQSSQQINLTIDPSLLPESEGKMIGVAKEKNPRQAIQTRIVNIFSPEYSRLTDKVIKAIFNQRKEISEGKTTFEQFIRTFMINQYGSHLHFVLSTRITATRSDQSPLVQVFDVLLNSYESTSYLQIIFCIFAKMLAANGSCILQVDAEKAVFIQNQILNSYIGEEVQQIQDFSVNLGSLFVEIQQRIHWRLKCSELYQFLQFLIPRSQLVLSYEQLRQMLGIFVGEQFFLKRLLFLKHLCKTDISPLVFCIYAFRQKWTSLINIQTFIENKFQTLFGQFNEDWTDTILLRCNRSQRLKWTLNLLKSNWTRQHYCRKNLRKKYLSLLFVGSEVESMLPISQNLQQISNQFESTMLKNNYDSMLL